MEINIYQVLFQIFNFGVVMYLLNKVLYKPVLKMLQEDQEYATRFAKAKAEAAAMMDSAAKEIESNKAKADKAIATLATKQAQLALGGSLSAKEIDSITTSMLKAK